MFGLLILLLFLLAGEAIARLTHVPIPGNVIGMILLTLALQLRLVKLELVKPAADFLVRNMALFFVPAGVGVLAYLGPLKQAWLPILVATVGWLQQRLERR